MHDLQGGFEPARLLPGVRQGHPGSRLGERGTRVRLHLGRVRATRRSEASLRHLGRAQPNDHRLARRARGERTDRRLARARQGVLRAAIPRTLLDKAG